MGLRQATFFLAELFRQAMFYLAELFRQITSSNKYTVPPMNETNNIAYEAKVKLGLECTCQHG